MKEKIRKKIETILNKDYPYAGDTQFPVVIELILNTIEMYDMGIEVLELPDIDERRKGERRTHKKT